MSTGIHISATGIDDLLNTMDAAQANKFMGRVMNKLADRGKTAAIKKIMQIYYLRRSDINVFVNHTNATAMHREIIGKGRPIPIDHYKYQAGSIGVMIKRRKDSTDFLRFAFIQRMPNGKVGVFKQMRPIEKKPDRHGWLKARIEKVFTPSIADILEGDNIRTEVQQVVADAAPAVIDQEFNYIMNVEGKR